MSPGLKGGQYVGHTCKFFVNSYCLLTNSQYPLNREKTIEKGMVYPKMQQDSAAETILERLSDLENYPEEQLTPYEEFEENGETYYFTPGGFLYRRDEVAEELGGFFCGYLTDEVWRHRTALTGSVHPTR